MLPEKDQRILNGFACECFLDTADFDYVSARASYRMGLIQHFQWNALQSIEKYFKAILLFNGKSSKNLGHNIEKAHRRVRTIETFDIPLKESSIRLMSELNRFGENRYLERESHTKGNELLTLDLTVWSIRKYCQVLDFEVTLPSGKRRNILREKLIEIESKMYKENPSKFKLIGGKLESIINRPREDLLRQNLIWKNFYYGKRTKKKVKNFKCNMYSVYPPHIREPEKIELLKKYALIPGEKQEDISVCAQCGEEI
ncbi:HEPN domain-containing protein [Teredinibacter turnerae]|uniref:HEPN domain-containing protein n=1 Tax=Teredinibacter turnerae TaxID=2426 RepID=UPI000369897E|nr:HEPN domain-containing protein [Teredinibacter turnerae]